MQFATNNSLYVENKMNAESEQKVVMRISNGDIVDDLQCPQIISNRPSYVFGFFLHIFGISEARLFTFLFISDMLYQVLSLGEQMTHKRAWSGSSKSFFFAFLSPYKTKKRYLKCTKTKRLPKNDMC